MKDYMKLKLSSCKNCYKCLRHCPVKAIKFENNQASITTDACILCGNCFLICPQSTKEIINNTADARGLIRKYPRVYASIAPSFAANFPGVTIASMKKALQELGFYDVQETAVGATLVKKQYEQMLREGRQDVIISSCCHTVNLLVEKYYPQALPFLAPVLSPMQAHCKAIKNSDPEAKTVFIGPCISKKAEADAYEGLADCVLTFDELTDWMNEAGVVFTEQPDDNNDSKARLFPTAGGILRTMEPQDTDYTMLVVDGIEACREALRDIVSGKVHRCFIEMSACQGSCIGGPGMNRERRTPIQNHLAVIRQAGTADFPVSMPDSGALHKTFAAETVNEPQPADEEIEAVLRQLGKTRPEHELNCGTCGYDTCREKAAAVLAGKADLMMCLPFLMEKAESFSDTIIRNTPNGILVLNEQLQVQRLNEAALRMLRIKDPADILEQGITRILPADDFVTVLDTGRNIYEHRYCLAAQPTHLEQTVLYDENYHIIIVILRDVSAEESQRARKEHISQQTIDTADKVIEKQMRAVQEIASLLGETTAEIKVALTNLKESLHGE